MEITFKDKQIELRFSFRSDILFEDATGHSFTGANETEWLQYFFCTLVAITKDESLRFDDFLDWISDNPHIFYDFVKWYTEYQTSVLELRKKADSDTTQESKKKVSRSKKK